MNTLPLLYGSRSPEEVNFISDVCKSILAQPLEIGDRPESDDFAAIYVEGREREFCLEDLASLWSFKVFSRANYPIFLFLANPDLFLDEFNKLGIKYPFRLVVDKIDKINSLEDYSKFMIRDVFFRIPAQVENILTVSPDSGLLKIGWEDWLIRNDFSLIGSAWQHYTSLVNFDKKENTYWSFTNYPPVSGCNLGFSFRKASKMRKLSVQFSGYNLKQRGDSNCPEDVFYSYFGFGTKLCKLPTREEMNTFSKDPLTRKDWQNKTHGYGFHFFERWQ